MVSTGFFKHANSPLVCVNTSAESKILQVSSELSARPQCSGYTLTFWVVYLDSSKDFNIYWLKC